MQVLAVIDDQIEDQAALVAGHDQRVAARHAQAPALAFALHALGDPVRHRGR